MNKVKTSSLVAGLLIATNLTANENIELSPIIVSSTLIQTDELKASFASEIYTKDDIQASKSKDVYDFLSSQTSVNVSPNYGNTFSQKLDLRGYGITDGYQNVVVLVNGRKLNNIDMTSQLLSSIPLESIEKIEILKGSGSVQYGDGANAGAINIITNGQNDRFIKASYGSNGTKNGVLSLSHVDEKFVLNGYVDYTSTDGTRADNTGKKDENYNRNKNFNIIYFPTDNLELRLARNYSNMNIKYGGKLTKEEYNSNPNKASSFTEQYFRSYVTTAGLTYDFNNKYSLDVNVSDENKLSRYSTGYTADYDYKSFNTKLNIKGEKSKTSLGFDGFLGDSKGSTSITSKDNKAAFISNEYYFNDKLTLSSGARKEYVEYTYAPNSGTHLNKEVSLNAFDLGVNYVLDKNSSFFANFNKSYQAPDINRFFKSGNFNGFIEPAKVNNFTVGYNHITNKNKLKLSVFRSDLKNEIYYYSTGNWATSFNTNIDKSHKYGIELYDKFIISDNFFTSINYSYIIAKIDEEDQGNGAYNGKNLPGVSKHNVTLNLGYNYDRYKAVLSHTYRSSTYAANDFENNFNQKQEAYKSTDLTLSYDFKNIEVFAKVQNIFDEKNGLWIKDDNIYPVNFERTYNFGAKVKF